MERVRSLHGQDIAKGSEMWQNPQKTGSWQPALPSSPELWLWPTTVQLQQEETKRVPFRDTPSPLQSDPRHSIRQGT